jgi:hypothetical protein
VGKAVFGPAKRQQEILAENFTGMNGGVFFYGLGESMVVNDLNLMRAVGLPARGMSR